MHQHWCPVTGHYWECPGSTARPLLGQYEPTMCMCLDHECPMEDGDHSKCSVELLACPEHRDEQLRAMGYESGTDNMPPVAQEVKHSRWTDAEGNPIIGFCLWCGRDFYDLGDMHEHNADNMAACPVFQEHKDTGGMPPVLQDLLEGDEQEDEDDEKKE